MAVVMCSEFFPPLVWEATRALLVQRTLAVALVQVKPAALVASMRPHAGPSSYVHGEKEG